MTPRTITIFGGSGFLGRRLVKRLAAQGAIVRVAVRYPEGANYLRTMGDAGQIIPVAADIMRPSTVAAAIEGADEVVNLVGTLSQWGKSTFQRLHVEGAAIVARTAAEAGAARLVHLSAIGADASSPAEYGRSKAAGEAAVMAAYPGATIVRPSVMFGPEDRFFNLFAGLARISPVLPVFGCSFPPRLHLANKDSAIPVTIDFFGHGGSRMQPVYVGDVAEAIIRLLDKSCETGSSGAGATPGAIYELGGPTIYSFKEIIELLVDQIGRKKILVPVHFNLALINAWFLEKFPNPLLTRDQIYMLMADNVVADQAPGFARLGIEPVTAEAILPTYLTRFRPVNSE